MKAPARFPRFLLLLLVIPLPTARAATVFTTDTLIGVNDMTYEGQDIVVSNAVLTVDGSHTFNSLRVAAGAMLTHSDAASGSLPFIALANELYQLNDTNPVTLVQSGIVLSSFFVTDTNGLVTYTNDIDYVLTNVGTSFTLQRTMNSFIPDGDTVFVSYDYQSTTMAGLIVTVTTDMEIEPGARVDADGRGFGGGAGTGAGGSAGTPSSGGGAGHGGYGGLSSSNAAGGLAYGGAFGVGTRGSGGGAGIGGAGGSGGGLILLWVGGNCVLNGNVTANGQNATNSRAGGGAGGGISISAPTISGNGMLSANGGAGEPVHGGGGGGGRIALVATTNLFTGTLSAAGGAGWQRGGAGTVFTQDDVAGPKLTIDNGGQSGAVTLVDMRPNGTALVIQGMAHVVNASGVQQSVTNLIVRAGSSISATAATLANLIWYVSGDALIEPGATMHMRGNGYPADQGPGVGASSNFVGGGAGHGGYGGSGVLETLVAPGGTIHGSITSPRSYGSGSRTVGRTRGSSGGGVIRLSVTGKLQLDGEIIADGDSGNGTEVGGAAGGSVWLVLGGFAGRGLISANGGHGGVPYGGGGAGGRIAVTYSSNAFNGTLTAAGGDGAVAGGAGTIYTKGNASSYADLRIDNGGSVGTNTPSDLTGSHNLTITGGAICRSATSQMTLGSVVVGPDSKWLVGNGSVGATITVASNVNVAAGGVISGDGLGFGSSSQGPGAGVPSPIGSSGGGHGGYGGRGLGFTNTFSLPGGNSYDSTANPAQAGSGGGSLVSGSGADGGTGGAALRLTILGALILDGQISANGRNGLIKNSGGGAGGSVWLTLNQFSGSGSISADGGGGHLPNGGGGGGGRIAVYWNSNSFTGTYSAKGGNGFVAGGAGTIYLKPDSAAFGSLTVDNGGRRGTNTVLDVSPLADLTIGSGASVHQSTSSYHIMTVSNLSIGPEATLQVGVGTTTTLNISGTARIAAGGSLQAVVRGSSSGSGTGQSSPLAAATEVMAAAVLVTRAREGMLMVPLPAQPASAAGEARATSLTPLPAAALCA